jgi:peptide/nickel transport system substrate-binding protein
MARNTVKIEQIDPKKVSLTTKIVDASIPFFFCDAVGAVQGLVMPRWELDKIHDDEKILAYDRNPIGAGIMKLVRHVPAEVMQFERFDDYYEVDRRVKFRSLDLRQVPEEATRVAALRAGEADIAPISLASKGQLGGGRLVFGPEGTYLWVRFREPWIPDLPISKKEVRQALAYALDLKVFQERLWGAEVFAPKGWNHVTPSALGYSPELDPYPYDPQKARQLLVQAGYPGGKEFPTLILNTYVSRATPLLPESAQLAADMWKKELGIPVEVRLGDEAKFKKDWVTEGALRGQLLWRDNETRVDGGNIIRGTFGTPTAAGRQHNDPAVFKLAQESISVLDLAKRHEAYNKFYRVIREEVFELGLGYQNIPWGVGPRIKEWTPFPMSFWPSGLHTITLK